jgi:hypothetical protein
MRKSLILLAALLALSAVLSACGAGGTEPAVAPTPAVTEVPAATDVPVATDTPAVMPDISKVKTDIEAMMPILDSIVGTMGIGEDSAYTPNDDAFCWYVLYLMGVNWGATHPLVEQTDECVIVPRQAMREFASAAFLDHNDLPAVPDDMAQSVQYDEGLDAYRLAYSDRGNTETRMGALDVAADGTVTVNVELYEIPDELLGTIAFTLVANTYVEGLSEPIYLYAVSAATLGSSGITCCG